MRSSRPAAVIAATSAGKVLDESAGSDRAALTQALACSAAPLNNAARPRSTDEPLRPLIERRSHWALILSLGGARHRGLPDQQSVPAAPFDRSVGSTATETGQRIARKVRRLLPPRRRPMRPAVNKEKMHPIIHCGLQARVPRLT